VQNQDLQFAIGDLRLRPVTGVYKRSVQSYIPSNII
jgi:hypothetical protein